MSKSDQPGALPPDVTVADPQGATVTQREYLGENGKRVIEVNVGRSLRTVGR